MYIHDDRDLGLLIRARRKRMGLDQATVARRAGVSRQWLIEVEKGRPRAEISLLLRTLRVLGLTVIVEEQAIGDAAKSTGPDPDLVVERARRRKKQ